MRFAASSVAYSLGENRAWITLVKGGALAREASIICILLHFSHGGPHLPFQRHRRKDRSGDLSEITDSRRAIAAPSELWKTKEGQRFLGFLQFGRATATLMSRHGL